MIRQICELRYWDHSLSRNGRVTEGMLRVRENCDKAVKLYSRVLMASGIDFPLSGLSTPQSWMWQVGKWNGYFWCLQLGLSWVCLFHLLHLKSCLPVSLYIIEKVILQWLLISIWMLFKSIFHSEMYKMEAAWWNIVQMAYRQGKEMVPYTTMILKAFKYKTVWLKNYLNDQSWQWCSISLIKSQRCDESWRAIKIRRITRPIKFFWNSLCRSEPANCISGMKK